MFKRALLIGLLFIGLISAPASFAEIYPQYADVYVDDFADLLQPSDEASIRAQLISLYDKTGVEAVVVTIPSLARYQATALEPYATALFNTWGVGNAQKNNGVMVLIARDDRKIRIEVGSGYGHDLDADMQYIIDKRFLPSFRLKDYPGGIRAGVDELVRELEVKAGVLAPPGIFDRAMTFLTDASLGVLSVLGTLALACLGGISWLYQQWRRSQPRFCPDDGSRMDLMSEDSDDTRLAQGQVVEERVGSVDYDVWSCPKCQRVTVEAYRRWFSSYGACRSCHYRTLQGTTTILSYPTTIQTGQKRIDYHCENCGTNYSEIQTIPKKNSSGGAGRTSFGGGSSSGGGASGSW